MATFRERLFGITPKMLAFNGLLLCGVVVGLGFFATRIFSRDNQAMIQQVNFESASKAKSAARKEFQSVIDRARLFAVLWNQNWGNDAAREQILAEILAQDGELKGVYQIGKIDQLPLLKPGGRAAKDFVALLKSEGAAHELVESVLEKHVGEFQGTLTILPVNESGFEGYLGVSRQGGTDSGNGIDLAFVFRGDGLRSVFTNSGPSNLLLVSRAGRVLSGSAGYLENYGDLVKSLDGKTLQNAQKRYRNASGKWILGSLENTGLDGLWVLSETTEDRAYESSHRIAKRAFNLALGVLGLAFGLGYVFSISITRPIERLSRAVGEIAAGQFEVGLGTKRSDELGRLENSIGKMAVDLAERERMKDVLNKFHNPEIAKKLLSGTLKLGGERKEAVIFFSDLRGFTEMSEGMSSEATVELLNEYLSRMVRVIREHDGIVDKFVGDAIMALWGVPESTGSEAAKAVAAAIEMRRELARLNEERIARKEKPLRMGMGINLGEVTAGNIGSDEKMEYTVIGDAVNTASRIESITKEFGTDLLISRAVAERVSKNFVLQTEKSAWVKGKSAELQLFRVMGLIHANGQNEIVQTPYSEFKAEKSDKSVDKSSDKSGDRSVGKSVDKSVGKSGDKLGDQPGGNSIPRSGDALNDQLLQFDHESSTHVSEPLQVTPVRRPVKRPPPPRHLLTKKPPLPALSNGPLKKATLKKVA